MKKLLIIALIATFLSNLVIGVSPSPVVAQSPLGEQTIVLGTENEQYPGNGLGYIYKDPYQSFLHDRSYMETEKSPYGERRGFAVFNLDDLVQWPGVTVISGEILARSRGRYRVTDIEFYILDTIPYDEAPSGTVEACFSEAGGTGTVQLAAHSEASESNASYYDVHIPLTTEGINEINDRLTNSAYDFPIGSVITGFYQGADNGSWDFGDVRLVLNFSYASEPEAVTGEIAVGDDLSGYTQKKLWYPDSVFYEDYHDSSVIYCRYVQSSGMEFTWRGHATWDASVLRSSLPQLPQSGPEGATIAVTEVEIRLNSFHIDATSLELHHMENNPLTSSVVETYTDAGDGTTYAVLTSGDVNTPQQLDIDLGPDALSDVISVLEGSADFFAIGFNIPYGLIEMYSPQLILKWKVDYPIAVFGAENQQYPGNGMGKIDIDAYPCCSYWIQDSYFMYNFEHYSPQDEHGFAVYNLDDLAQWPGVNIISGEIWARNFQRSNATEIQFYIMDTIPYEGASKNTSEACYNEAGGVGTVKLATYSESSATDASFYDIRIPITPEGITEINDRLSDSEYDLAIGSVITQTTSGNALWLLSDVRLVLTFAYTSAPSAATGEIAIGDVLGGVVTTDVNYDQGFLTVGGSGNAYIVWDAAVIKKLVPQSGPGKAVTITNIYVRINVPSSYQNFLELHHMEHNPITASASEIFTDAADGTTYASFTIGEDLNNPRQFDIDLGPDAISDVTFVLQGSRDFFAIGLSGIPSFFTNICSPQLVIKWQLIAGDPVADSGGPYNGTVGVQIAFDGSGSYDPDGTIISYEWDFGDGDTGTGVAPSHTYTTTGTYTVTLTVTDDEGKTDTTSTTAEIIEQDYGDAPDPDYPTLQASNGARHTLSGLFLGASVDSEIDGQPDTNAMGDDTAASDDEDGVTFTSLLVPGDSAQIDLVASAAGMVDAWIDYNRDGDWTDAGEQVFTSVPVSAGSNSLSLTVPEDAVTGDTYARFRISSTGGLSFDGAASDGEVEDYMIEITPANQPPIADIGGPYLVDEGDTVTLDGSGSSDPDDNIVSYEWDLDNDGEYDDAVGETTTRVFNDNGIYTVGLKVTDSYGEYDTDTTTVTVSDLGPIAHLTGDSLLDEGQPGSYDASGSTSSPDAIVLYEWDWDYDGSTFTSSGDTSMTQSHVWNDDGTYTVVVRVTDDDGSSDITTLSVTVENPPPKVMVEALIEKVDDNTDISEARKTSIIASLDTALKVLEDSNPKNDVAAINVLKAFIKKVEAQCGKKIPEAVADALIAKAQDIIAVLSLGP